MAFGSFSESGGDEALAEINMVPLIDVMLVLLVIFIVAAPMLTHAVKVNLPRVASTVNQPRPDTVQVSIDAGSRVHWNSEIVTPSLLAERLGAAAALTPQPELHLRAERTTPYEKVAEVMAAAARAGVTRIGFVTDPTP